MMALLDGKVVVVTGAARGIGRAIAAASGRQGARVVLVDRLADELASAAAALRDEGFAAEARVCELGDEASVASLFDDTVRAHGRIDGLVNNAGTTVYGGSLDTTLDALMQVLRIH